MPKYDSLGYYAVLEVSPNASAAEIKRQYYERAKFWHPDRNQSENAQDMFQRVSSAYGVLQNSHSRLIYDILSAIYGADEFPLIGSLKIYKNQKDIEDKALRVLKQYHVKRGKITESKDVCNFSEAADLSFSTSVGNWLKGWWGKNGLKQTFLALKQNFRTVTATNADNVKLLVHNAVAYEQENNIEMAWIYAKQAQNLLENNFNNRHLQNLLQQFIIELEYTPSQTVVIPFWNYKALKLRQLYIPLFLLTAVAATALVLLLRSGILQKNISTPANYYEEWQFADGSSMASDTIAAKIFKIDSSANNDKDLAHFKRGCTVYHGPDEQYSPMLKGKRNQTVRISGYTADKSWMQIVVDSGEIGYVRADCLNKGKKNAVPVGSKVYKGY